MSDKALVVMARPAPKSMEHLYEALKQADQRGATQEARGLAQEIRDRDKQPPWQNDPIILDMPNGYELQLQPSASKEEQALIAKDYVRVLQLELHKKKYRAIRDALLFWSIPAVLLLVSGLAFRWVYSGFRRSES